MYHLHLVYYHENRIENKSEGDVTKFQHDYNNSS